MIDLFVLPFKHLGVIPTLIAIGLTVGALGLLASFKLRETYGEDLAS